MDEDRKEVIAIILAFIGYFATYFITLRITKRKDKLDKLNKQLGEYYGPLYALILSNQKAFEAFKEKYRPDESFFDKKNVQNINTWRHYVTVIFMPTNDKIFDVIVTKSDLLIEGEMPRCLEELITHITFYRAVVKSWEKYPEGEDLSINYFPTQSREYIYKSFKKLKKEQHDILNKKFKWT